MEMKLLTHAGTKIKARTVLNKSAEYVARNVLDGKADTCWNSDQGAPQYLLLDFEKGVSVDKITIAFQGGFVGQDVDISIGDSIDNLSQIALWETLEDNNEPQNLDIPNKSSSGRYVKINFPRSTDFYCRVTVYNLEIYGEYV